MTAPADPHAWLDARRPAPPAGLLARLHAALDALPAAPEPIPEHLAAAAFDRLRAALALGPARAAAYELLAADALLTYAWEAAAEEGPETLARLARLSDPHRLATLLEPEPHEEPARR